MSKNITSHSEYSYNNNNNYQNNNSQHDFKESINRSLDETKQNINKSIEESRNQIPRYNTIVNSYQEQSLQAAKEISEEYIESQKAIISSIQSAFKPYSESFTGMVNSFSSQDSIVKAYSRFVSNVADNAVSSMRVTNNMIFSNLDSWKSGLQQVRDNSKQIFNQNVNAAKTFEHNSREINQSAVAAIAVKDASSNSNTETTIHNTTQQSNKKI